LTFYNKREHETVFKKGKTMKDRVDAMILASFVADALSLGVHWVYNTNVIDKKFGRVDDYLDPLTSFHKGKKAGEQTHYGDQMLVLMDSLATDSGFDLASFARRWGRFFDTYTGYFDHATKDTRQHLAEGRSVKECGSASDDLAGASRVAPLFKWYAHEVDNLVQAARQQTAFTHNRGDVIDAAEFFVRTAARVLDGAGPLEAVEEVTAGHFKESAIAALVEDGLDSRERDTRQVIADFGQMCSVEAALPGTLHLIARYENDFEAALVENVMAGGDSAARGMPAAMILGACHGLEAIPGKWLDGLTAKTRIDTFLSDP
jgi:ADP-ribosylglycohydrolase